MRETQKTTVSAAVEPIVRKSLKKLARARDTPMSRIIEEAITLYLDTQPELAQHRPVKPHIPPGM